MDLLSQHEAFLRAIFDAPDDDTPRLVYADFLQEHGDEDRAAYIRYECEAARCEGPRWREINVVRLQLLAKHHASIGDPWPWDDDRTTRGFPDPPVPVFVRPEFLGDPDGVRASVVGLFPEWFGATVARVLPAIRPEHVATLFALPFTQQVREWDFGGVVEEVAASQPDPADGPTFGLIDMDTRPVVTTAGVEALAGHRGARRITSLILTNNNLDNDAARALVRSPYLDNLKRLDLLQGNRLRGKVWQQVVGRFGENVVG